MKYIAHFSGDSLIFDCEEIEEDLVYLFACHSVACYVLTNAELLSEVLLYLELDGDQLSEFNSLDFYDQVAELGEKFYDDSNWIFVTDYIE